MTDLATAQISKNFSGVQALKALSLAFGAGRVTGLVGPNGSGKSTLVHLLSGLLPMSGGCVILSGRNLTFIKPYRILKYGMTRSFQDGRLIEQMSVLDNLLLAMAERRPLRALFEFRQTKQRARAEDLLKKVGLWEKRDALAANLSYGQRKLLEIARAMATDAQVFLFDEPFSGLFPEVIEVIVGLIEDLKAQGKTIVLIEHNMPLIERLCHHVFVLNAGELLAEGPPQEVLNDRAVLEAYLGQ